MRPGIRYSRPETRKEGESSGNEYGAASTKVVIQLAEMRVGVDMLNRAMGTAGLTGAVIQHPRTAQQSCETARGSNVEFNLTKEVPFLR